MLISGCSSSYISGQKPLVLPRNANNSRNRKRAREAEEEASSAVAAPATSLLTSAALATASAKSPAATVPEPNVIVELWDSVPQCISANLTGPKVINEIRRGLECSLIHFCLIGDTKMSSTNRKMTKRRGLSEQVPDQITFVSSELNYYVPEEEGTVDFSPFTDLLDDAVTTPITHLQRHLQGLFIPFISAGAHFVMTLLGGTPLPRTLK